MKKWLISITLWAALGAQASLIGTYKFTGNSLAGTDADGTDGITLSDMNANSLKNVFDNSDLTGTSTPVDGFVRWTSDDDLGTSIEDNLDNLDYLSFTVNNNSGKNLVLTDIKFDYQRQSTWKGEGYLYSSVQGTGSYTNDAIGVFPGGNTTDAAFQKEVVDLTASSTEFGANVSVGDFTLADGESIDLILYFFNNSNKSNRAIDLDNISVSGDPLAVPEPATIGMLGLGALITILIRRRARNV